MKLDASESYNMYRGMKLHFNGGYDYLKYRGTLKSTGKPIKDTPQNRTKIRFAGKLLKKYDYNLRDFYLANFIDNPKKSLPQMVDNEAEIVYYSWKSKIESLNYVFSKDMETLKDKGIKFPHLFNFSDNGEMPPILESFLYGEICIETLLIIGMILPIRKKWKDLTNPKWDQIQTCLDNYTSFLDVDLVEYTKIIKQTFEKRL